MKTTVKVFSLLALTLIVAKELQEAKDEKISWRAACLLKDAKRATALYPSSTLKKSQIKQINNNFLSIEFDMYEKRNLTMFLSFILCGIDDILFYSKNSITIEIFNNLAKKIVWLNSLIDPKLNKDNKYIKADFLYQKWENK